jgi:serine/threonine protein kinase
MHVLGEGGMGRVYLARQQTLKRQVCVKVLAVPPGEEPHHCRERFRREAELLASVSHPHILSVFDYGTTADSGLPFLVTEYVEGGDLRHLVSEGRVLPIGEVLSILAQVGDALDFLHGKGIIHRDLKPENILMPTGSHCMVGDFGLAVMQGSAGLLTQSVRGLGTPGYVSPEQQYGLKVDERSDQYSLAAVAYELLTGRRPLGRFAPPSRVNPRLPVSLDPVILRALAEEPDDRFASVREFLRELRRVLDALPRKHPILKKGIAALVMTATGAAACVFLASGWRRRAEPDRQQREAPAAASQSQPRPAEKTATELGADPKPDHSPEFIQLTRLRAYRIWDEEGRPQGKAGEAVKDTNWSEAERQIDAEVKARAYQLWEEQGRPEGAAGEAVREKNLRDAELQLLKETEEEFRLHPIR